MIYRVGHIVTGLIIIIIFYSSGVSAGEPLHTPKPATKIADIQNDDGDRVILDCDEVVEDDDFEELFKYCKDNTWVRYAKCARINDHEYYIFMSSYHKVGGPCYFLDFSGVHYLNTNDNVFDIVGYYNINSKIEGEFYGDNGNKYALVSGGGMEDHKLIQSYYSIKLFNDGSKPSINRLISSEQDPEDGLCGENTRKFYNNLTRDIKGYNMLKVGTKDVSIVFDVAEQNCKTLKVTKRKYVFMLSRGIFKLYK